MVRKSAKGKVLGKEVKLQQVAGQKQAISARVKRDDKRWKRVLSKMASTKKAEYAAMQKVARRGVTRRFLRPNKERKPDTVAYEATIHMAKLIKGSTFHKRAPRAVKKIREVAQTVMKTKDNRVDGSLNNFLWSRGVKGVPNRVRVKIQRKVAESSDKAAGKRKHLYSVIYHVPCSNFKGLLTKTVVKK